MAAKKYRKGPRITTMAQLEAALDLTGFVYFNHKILHKGWIDGMTYRTIKGYVNCRMQTRGAWMALKNEVN